MAALTEILPIPEAVAALGLGATISAADEATLQMLKGQVEDDARQYCQHGITQPASAYVEFYPPVDRELPGRSGFAEMDVRGGKAFAVSESNGEGHILQLNHIFSRDDGNLEVREDFDAHFGMEAGDFPASTVLTEGTDFYMELSKAGLSKSGRLIRRSTDWSARAGTIQVTYMAGFTAAELDEEYRFVKGAVMEELIHRWGMFKSRSGAAGAPGPVKSESIAGEYSVTYATDAAVTTGELLPSVKRRLRPIVNYGGYLG